MIKIKNIKLPLNYTADSLPMYIAKAVKIKECDIKKCSLERISIDARNKEQVCYIASVSAELSGSENLVLKKFPNITERYVKYKYDFSPTKKLSSRPVIVGSGPAGIFAALTFARYGEAPIVIERGCDVDKRSEDVQNFFSNKELLEHSNIQFGEGGAGTFSDGKLNTGTKDSRATHVLRTFAEFGADKNILINAKPHIGTDVLKDVIKNIREEIISLGGEYYFETQLVDIDIIENKVKGVFIKQNNTITKISTDTVILATGHSARDTFEMLLDKGLIIEQKPFSLGVRIEHSREEIDSSQYGKFAKSLPAADYKLSTRFINNRGVYTFCMCPGGYVVNASSEDKRLCTNGMSFNSRNGKNSNSAVLVSVSPQDFPDDSPLSGINLQREIESKAYIAGGSDFTAPVETVNSFLYGNDNKIQSVIPTIETGYNLTHIDNIFPNFISEHLKLGIKSFGTKLKAFNNLHAVITAAETRSSSPIKISRNEKLESLSVKGIYPCGEGAGYAGGIVSAAVDGIKCAEMAMSK